MEKKEFYAEARSDLSGPLDGVRVIDITTAWAGPIAGCLLADFGADVIRVAPPGSPGLAWPPLIPDTTRPFGEETVNRNKRGISIDLRNPDGPRFQRLDGSQRQRRRTTDKGTNVPGRRPCRNARSDGCARCAPSP